MPLTLAEASEASGRTVRISSAQELLTLAENCQLDSYSTALTVKLEADIDLSDFDFQGIPIFSGVFEGQGHTISGLEIWAEGSYQGFFRYLTASAQVKNLNLEGRLLPGGSRSTVGLIAGQNSGLISGCSVSAELSGADKVGGIAGENLVSGIIEDCSFTGDISGNHFTGGMAGENLGVIRRCTNHGKINVTPQQNAVNLSEITLDSIMGTEAVNTVTDIGGIAGSSQGYIHDCLNYGAVGYELMGYNIGGIAGSQMGYIANCKNYADISGRKEIGGIVGQMEPTAFVAFERDALQVLEGQMNGLASSIGGLGAGAQALGGTVSGHVGQMMMEVQGTQQALWAILSGGINGDSFIAAQNVLSGSLANLQMSMQSMVNGVGNAVGAISGSISAMSAQVEQMRSTLGNITDAVGGTMRDVSDNDSPDVYLGKVEACENHGNITGDMNIGGITGAIAFENDLDLAEDIELGENRSLNFVSEIRAVILSCKSSANISVRHNRAGGIVGMTQFGLVKNCSSIGEVKGESAEYIGGIAGESNSFIRSCNAKGRLTGAEYVGGIAGEGVTVSDCRSMVSLEGSERTGAVLGYAVQETDDNGQPKIWGNVYLNLGSDRGGIDGISYSGVAHALSAKNFFALGGLSEIFRRVELSFVQENGDVSIVAIESGSRIPAEDIPPINEKPGHLSHWEGLEDVDYDYDTSFHAAYTPLSSTLESVQRNEAGLPLLLAEGKFQPGSSLELVPMDVSFKLADHEKLLAVFGYKSSDGGYADTVRYRIADPEAQLKAFALDGSGQWQPVSCRVVGSYAVVDMPEGGSSVAIIRVGTPLWVYAAAVAGGSAFLLTIMLISGIRKRKKRKKLKAAKKEKTVAA